MRQLNRHHRHRLLSASAWTWIGLLGACGDDSGEDTTSNSSTLTGLMSSSDSATATGHADESSQTETITSSSSSPLSSSTTASSDDPSSTGEETTSSEVEDSSSQSETSSSEESSTPDATTESEETSAADETSAAEESTSEADTESEETTSAEPIDCPSNPDCGDDCQQVGEQCDDGNDVGGDGCSSTCQLESCGNRRVDSGEECDDGNDEAGDGCSPACEWECGDGVIAGSESCDDGDRVDDALCSATCVAKCGDGVIGDAEECDDSNRIGGDGCSAECQLEACGNAVVDSGEGCDDGNREFGDGCDYWCQSECGNQHRFLYSGAEQCDDGNTVDGDGCSSTCQLECGDEIVGELEECEPGDEGCDDQCRWMCGNGRLEEGEECDDGNALDDDGCSAECQETVASIAAGGSNSCAVLPNGELRCWGLNDNGQLGHDPSEYDNLGDASAETPATANSVVISDTTWFEIAAISPNFTCARASDERVYCWGKNSEGQLGRGDFTAVEYFDADELESVDVGTDSDAVKSLAVGDNFACVVVDYTNEVKCWGDDSVRQLGDGQTTNLNEPGPAVDLTHYAIKVAAGGSTACALLAVPGGDDSVRCWGEGSFGQLGDGGATDSADDTPSVITLDGNATDVSVGGLHVCAVVDGAVSCWGDNEAGKLGIAEATAQSDTPASAVQVEGETFVSVSAGLDHTCALTQSGNVYCWGSNASGQLGNGDSTELPETEEPTLIDFGEEGLGASEIASGSFHTCALLTNGRVRCWGEGSEGQLGQGSTDSLGDTEAVAAIADVQVIGPAPLCGNNVREGWETCDDGNTVNDNSCPSNCYSPCGDGIAFENEDCDDGNSDPNDGCTNDCKESFARVFVGGNNSYALSDDNLFKGWGAGEQAQYVPIAGYGSGWDPDLGTNLGDDESPSAHAIFLDFVFQNYTQHIYYGDYFAEVDEELTFDFVTTQSLTASDTHACAIGTNEAMYCWGYNDYGNLGLGSDLATPFPLRVKAGGKKAKQMGLGHTFTCALFDDHQVYCWGSNAYGQLGIDANDDALNLYLPSTPIVVDSIPSDANDVTIELLAVGGEHSCVKASNNKVYCWGRGEDFRLGTGDDSNRYEPDLDHPVNLGSGNVTALASGHYVSCALIESSGSTRVRCWGDNDNGLLGDSGATGTPGIGESFTVPGTPVKLVVGYAHACVLTSLGRVYCWGDNSVGQVMAGAAPSLDSPTQIDLGTDADGTPSTALDIGAGTAHNCIVASDHHIRCWGYSNLGQTGVGTETYGDENDEMELGFEHNVDVIGGDYDWWD